MEDYTPGQDDELEGTTCKKRRGIIIRETDFGNDNVLFHHEEEEEEITMDDIQSSSSCWTIRCFKITMAILVFVLFVLVLVLLLVMVSSSGEIQSTATTILLGTRWEETSITYNNDDGIFTTAESVDLSGDGSILVIGLNQANNHTGRVDVKYKKDSTSWDDMDDSRNVALTGDEPGDNFGHCVQVSRKGHIVMASGYGEGSSSDDDSSSLGGTKKGKVRAYAKQSWGWKQFGSDVLGEKVGDGFGISLSMDSTGTAFIVGANGNNNLEEGKNTSNGYAKVYQMNDDMREWEEKRKFFGQNNNGLGSAVAMSGDGSTICVGEPNYRILGEKHTTSTGRVQCYTDENWLHRKGYELVGQRQRSPTAAAGGGGGSHFGYSLSLNENGNVLAIGDQLSSDQKEEEAEEGSVVVYQYHHGKWHHYGEGLRGAGNHQGGFQCKLNAEGNVLAWTARGYDAKHQQTVGLVRVVQLMNHKHWHTLGRELEGDHAGDFFGERIALSDSGTVLAASSFSNPNNNNNNGTRREYVKTYSLT